MIVFMHVITRKRLLEFTQKHPDCANAINAWYIIMKNSSLNSFSELRQLFPSADKVGNLTVFNIGGSKVRLIAALHYNTNKIYIRDVLTHSEYDKGKWRD